MSTLVNTQPPQTYSRLFRPWDCSSRASPINQTIPTKENYTNKPLTRFEICPSYSFFVPTEQSNSMLSANDSDRECTSSSSTSSKSSSHDYSFNSSLQMMQSSSASSPPLTNNPMNQVPYANVNLYSSLENHAPHLAFQFQYSGHAAANIPHFVPNLPAPSPSDIYYAAAAAAVANGMPSVPTTTSVAAAAAAYGVDPYTLTLMEQEYKRVMAEEAHLKAVNARKQRPKKFKCPHCAVAFSNNGQLKGHIRIHTGERPFKCDDDACGKTFTRNEELTRHKRIHTGLRPYPCPECGKKFGRRDHLKKHMKTHTPPERQLATTVLVSMYPYLYGY